MEDKIESLKLRKEKEEFEVAGNRSNKKEVKSSKKINTKLKKQLFRNYNFRVVQN